MVLEVDDDFDLRDPNADPNQVIRLTKEHAKKIFRKEMRLVLDQLPIESSYKEAMVISFERDLDGIINKMPRYVPDKEKLPSKKDDSFTS